jgi:hypothetical protein
MKGHNCSRALSYQLLNTGPTLVFTAFGIETLRQIIADQVNRKR